MLKEKLSQKVEKAPSIGPGSSISGNRSTPVDKGPKKCPSVDKEPTKTVETSGVGNWTVCLNLLFLLTFAGNEANKGDENTFDRKLEKYAKLEQWNDHEKLLRLELQLKG